MEIKLCYKTYQVNPTLGAMKQFHDETGQDFWTTLLSVILEAEKCKQEGASVLDRLVRVSKALELKPNAVAFDVAANLFHCLIDKSLNIPLSEIRDGMFRCGWLPTDRDGDMGEPYTYVIQKLAYDINEAMERSVKDSKKKADT